MQFELLTLDGVKYAGQVREVALKTANGQMAILPRHQPTTAIAAAGPVVVHPVEGKAEVFATFGGLLEVDQEKVRLLADEAEHATELIQSEIDAALEKARQLKANARTAGEHQQALEMIDRQEVRLEVARLHRHHRSR